jgi:hypothetical protein
MKTVFLFLILAESSLMAFTQSDSVVKYILVPHPRSEDKVNQSVLPGIEQINFSKYQMILLGGDLTYYPSASRVGMDYCDSLFDLGDPNTLWTLGNHDITNRSLVEEYTGRPSYYSYSNNNITFLVLDTELDANGFISSHISGDQLAMVQQVCDSIENSDYLVLLHHRLLWMIGNDYFTPKLDSVAESTKQLDTSNFYAVIFPLLQEVKRRGVPVLCLGGDKSKINIVYSPEDSITFIASTMAPEYTDEQNNVVVLSDDLNVGTLSWEFIPLSVVEKNPPVSRVIENIYTENESLVVEYDPERSAVIVGRQPSLPCAGSIGIYSLSGHCLYSEDLNPGEMKTFSIRERGLYIVRLVTSERVECQKVSVQ